MTRKSSKKALLMSVLSLLLCCAMLVGSTFAWFTDTAKTGVNTITAGNLDVELKYDKSAGQTGDTWDDATATDAKLFAEDTLWEPGMMVYSKQFKVVNAGNLALIYRLTAYVENETTAADGSSLRDVIKMQIVSKSELDTAIETVGAEAETLTQEQRSALWENITDGHGGNPLGSYSFEQEILPKDKDGHGEVPVEETDPMVIVLYWKPGTEDEDNKYNMKNLKEAKTLSVDFGINVYATQTPFESDSFNDQYDANALAQEKVHEAVANGIANANEGLKAVLPDKPDALTVGKLTYDETSGHYNAQLTFGESMKSDGSLDIETLGTAYSFMANLVTEAVNAEKENIKTITIGSKKVEATGAEGAYQVSDMQSALLGWFGEAASSVGTSDKAAALKALENLTCSVAVEDMGGTVVIYDLTFDMSALADVLLGS